MASCAAGLSASPFGLRAKRLLNGLPLSHHFAMRQDLRKLRRIDAVTLQPLRYGKEIRIGDGIIFAHDKWTDKSPLFYVCEASAD